MKTALMFSCITAAALVLFTACGGGNDSPVNADLNNALVAVYGAENVTEGTIVLEESYTRAAELTLQIACNSNGCTGYTMQDQDRDRINQFNNNPLPNPYGVGRIVLMQNTFTYTQMVSACDGNASMLNKPVFAGRVDAGTYQHGHQHQLQLDCNGSGVQIECQAMQTDETYAFTGQHQQGNRYLFLLSGLPVGFNYLDCNATNAAGTTTLTDAIKVEVTEASAGTDLSDALVAVYGEENVTEGTIAIEENYTRAAELTLQIACNSNGCTGYTFQDQDRDRINQFNNNPLPNPYGVGRIVQMQNTFTYTEMLAACDGNASMLNKPVFTGRVTADTAPHGQQLQLQLDCLGTGVQVECLYPQNGNMNTSNGQHQNGNRYLFLLSGLPVGFNYLDCNATNDAGTTTLTDAITVEITQ